MIRPIPALPEEIEGLLRGETLAVAKSPTRGVTVLALAELAAVTTLEEFKQTQGYVIPVKPKPRKGPRPRERFGDKPDSI